MKLDATKERGKVLVCCEQRAGLPQFAVSLLDKIIEEVKAKPLEFGMPYLEEHMGLIASIAMALGKEVSPSGEAPPGKVSTKELINLIVNAGAADAKESDPDKWPMDIKKKVGRLLGHVFPGIMYEAVGLKGQTAKIAEIAQRQERRTEFQRDTLERLYNIDAASMYKMREELFKDDSLFTEPYEGVFNNIDKVQALYDQGKIPAEHYNEIMTVFAPFLHLVKNLNELYFLPDGTAKYPGYIKAIICMTCVSIEKQLEEKGYA